MRRIAEALVVRPGETLVIRYDGTLSQRQAQQVQQRLEDILPGVRIVVIQADQIAKLTAQALDEAVRMAQENPGRVVEVDE